MHTKIKNFIYIVAIIATLSIIPAIYFSLANTNDETQESVIIVNLANNQKITNDYIIKLQTQDYGNEIANGAVVDVELRFYRSDNSGQYSLFTQRYASRDGENSIFWHFNLQMNEFEDGNYKLDTFAHYSKGGVRSGETRIFSVSHEEQSESPEVNVKVVNPSAEEIISQEYNFTATVDKPVDELNFYIYDSNQVLKKYIQGQTTTPDGLNYSGTSNTISLENTGYNVKAQATLNNESQDSDLVHFYVYNIENDDSNNSSSTDDMINDQNDSSSTPTSTSSSTDDINDNQDSSDIIEVTITTPENESFVTGQILLQASVSKPVESLNFYVSGENNEYVEAESFEENVWQAYFDTISYDNNYKLDIIAHAINNNASYDSNQISVFVNNPEPIDNNEVVNDDNNQDNVDDNQNQQVDDNKQIDNNKNDEKNEDTEEIQNQEDQQDVQDEQQNQQEDSCVEYKNISCVDYLLKNVSIPDNCIEKVVDIESCNDFKNNCSELGFGEEYDLCEKYLNEPKSSIWCELDEFKKLPICSSYKIKQNKPELNITGLDRRCVKQKILDKEKCNTYLSYLDLPEVCRKKNILEQEKCQDFLHDNYFNIACQKLGIADKQACSDYLISINSEKYVCDNKDCSKEIKEKYVNELAFLFVSNEKIRSFINETVNGGFTFKQKNNPLAENFSHRLPVVYKEQNFKVVSAEDKILLDNNSLTSALPAVVVYDSDNDGLPDDMEKRLGTDVLNPDTDGDGYMDGEEVKNGYSPLKSAIILDKKLAPVEQAIISGKELEQPIFSGEISDDLLISNVKNEIQENIANINNEQVSITGFGPAFAVVTLYLYSDLPLVATIQADANGHWQYDLQDSLVDGNHKVYVAINDDTGKIIKKSVVRNFFVKEAKAVSADEYINLNPKKDSKVWEKYYLVGFVLLLIFAIFLIFLIYKKSFSSYKQ